VKETACNTHWITVHEGSEKMKNLSIVLAVWLLLQTGLWSACQENRPIRDGNTGISSRSQLYYGIQINSVLCGYTVVDLEPIESNGTRELQLSESTLMMITALGSKFNSEIQSVTRLDPASGQYSYQSVHIKQGPTDFSAEATIGDGSIIVTSSLSADTSRIAFGPDVLLRNSQIMPFLIKDFADTTVLEKNYHFFEMRDQEIQGTIFRRIGSETLKAAGTSYNALVLEEINQKTGLKTKWWVDQNSGYMLKMSTPRAEIFRSDSGVAQRIKIASMDDLIMLSANVAIADYQAISYMKIQARLQPSGLTITPASLNGPGQTFTGTVKENLIEGVFEIEHVRYDGRNAPALPVQFGHVDSLQPFIEADDRIESTDPVLIAKAKEISAGAADTWEAMIRLSQWVADSIAYAIPGGVTARNTFDLRRGECGAHSMLLAAFCRTLGIPARVVWGCMYVPNRGGAFGQHGWNEVYMGDAGWIPVDATAREIDYIDSGHLRIGLFKSSSTALNPKELVIQDYRVGVQRGADSLNLTERYQPYLGAYHGELQLKVIVQNGLLTVDIPGKVLLALNDPDENGIWYSKVAPTVFFEFSKNEEGRVTGMILHELITLPKKSSSDSLADVPKKLLPFVGVYLLPQMNADFKVYGKDGTLVIHNPLEKRDIKLQYPDARGRWKDEFNRNEIFFEQDDSGRIRAMKIDSRNRFDKEV
jgi:hypothetical protein